MINFDYMQHNQRVNCSSQTRLISLEQARNARPELLNRYSWRLFRPQQNYLTRQIITATTGYILELGRLVSLGEQLERKTAIRLDGLSRLTGDERPLRIGFQIDRNDCKQVVYNLIVVHAGERATVAVDCSSDQCRGVQHVSLTEVFLEEGARLELSMNHNWGVNTVVRPLMAARLAEDAELIYSYGCLQAPASLISSPKIILVGDNAKFRANSRLRVTGRARLRIGNRVWLRGANQSAQIVTKVVSEGGRTLNHDQITATGASQGHIECDGLVLGERASVASVPSIIAQSPEAELSHEASIGKLNPEQVEYLMTRGLTRDQAVELLVGGFLAEA